MRLFLFLHNRELTSLNQSSPLHPSPLPFVLRGCRAILFTFHTSFSGLPHIRRYSPLVQYFEYETYVKVLQYWNIQKNSLNWRRSVHSSAVLEFYLYFSILPITLEKKTSDSSYLSCSLEPGHQRVLYERKPLSAIQQSAWFTLTYHRKRVASVTKQKFGFFCWEITAGELSTNVALHRLKSYQVLRVLGTSSKKSHRLLNLIAI